MAQADGSKKKKTLNLAGFGTGQRFNTEKIFLSKQLAKQSHIGHGSPGPIYTAQNQQKYKKNPKWRFSMAQRKTWETKPKYDFYQNVGFPDDPIEADHARKENVLTRKFGTESRFNTALMQKTPGPKYYPNLKPQVKNTQKFTFGFRRNIQGASALSNAYSTPNNVGPANYLPQKCPLTGNKKKFSQWSFPKAPRVPAYTKTTDRNQTYDNVSSIGNQNISKRKTSPSAHFGSSTRAGNSRTGQFKDMMSTQEVKINIAHPRF